MQIRVEIDQECKETEVIIRAAELTEEIHETIQKLSVSQQKLLAGFTNDGVELLDASEVIRFYAENKKVYAQTARREFLVRLRLYELEERLDKHMFARISNSEIINLKEVRKIDLSFSGTICITLSNRQTVYVSRRFLVKIKEFLGI